jgi:ubiquinone/menaquinone biosynthesis C-methylase UbiE
MAALLAHARPDTVAVGVETFVRPVLRRRSVPLVRYDGVSLPFRDAAFDVALLSNVIHHADSQATLLSEACRVTRRRVVIKDHVSESWLAHAKLAVLDILGNRRFGAATTGEYLSAGEWNALVAGVTGWTARATADLRFRERWMATLFENRLEMMLVLDRDAP